MRGDREAKDEGAARSLVCCREGSDSHSSREANGAEPSSAERGTVGPNAARAGGTADQHDQPSRRLRCLTAPTAAYDDRACHNHRGSRDARTQLEIRTQGG